MRNASCLIYTMIDKCFNDLSNPSLVMLQKLNKDPYFGDQYAKDAGVVQGYTLFEHTVMVLGQFEKYFAVREWCMPLSLDVFRLMLCLHDIGKPLAVEEGDKKLQHGFTLTFIDEAAESQRIVLSSDELRIVKALIDGDAIGSLLKGHKLLDDVVDQIKNNAQESQLTLRDFFAMLVVYYQSDAGSYTEDAGGVRALDFLFEADKQQVGFAFDEQAFRLRFSKDFEEIFLKLQYKLFQ